MEEEAAKVITEDVKKKSIQKKDNEELLCQEISTLAITKKVSDEKSSSSDTSDSESSSGTSDSEDDSSSDDDDSPSSESDLDSDDLSDIEPNITAV